MDRVEQKVCDQLADAHAEAMNGNMDAAVMFALAAVEEWNGTPTQPNKEQRYREALESIANGDVPGVSFAEPDLISEFARAALKEETSDG